MKTLRLFLFGFITLAVITNAQTIIPPGDVSGTWTLGGSPYEIQGEITIPYLQTLTIEPGVIVEFQGHYKLNVQGRLLAVGTEADTIVFTINDTTGFHNPNIPDGSWYGIRFIDTSPTNDSSKITYCKLEYGKSTGLGLDSHGGAICVNFFDKLVISNSLITNNIANGLDWPCGGGISLFTSNAIIMGNTISNNWSLGGGGGIHFWDSSPQILNNTIVNNKAGDGGGILCNESYPTITNTTLENNIATDASGGGILCWNGSSPSLEYVTFKNNTAAFWGNGMQAVNCNLLIEKCLFIENNIGGGALAVGADTTYTGLPYQVIINNTSFIDNTSNSRAGLFINQWSGTPLIIDVTIDNCEFSGNTSDRYVGLCIYNCSFSLSNSIFTHNTAISYTAGAGFSSGCVGTVSNCVFASNIANTGGEEWNSGGLTVWGGSSVDIINCTFADNSAFYGAGLTVGYGGTATVTNCIFWGNSTDQIALGTYDNIGGTLFVNHCNVEGGEDSVYIVDPSLCTLNWGIGNLDADPVFTDPLVLDYHLDDSSPCIGMAVDSMEINGVMCYCPKFDIEINIIFYIYL